jgi:hypothetical protein
LIAEMRDPESLGERFGIVNALKDSIENDRFTG